MSSKKDKFKKYETEQPDLSSKFNSLKSKLTQSSASQNTITAVETMIKAPSNESIYIAKEAIDNDDNINLLDKTHILKQMFEIEDIKIIFINNYNFNNCPNDYDTLKKQAKFFAGLSQYSFMLMAQRLAIIQENELYKIQYSTFDDFIKSELSISIASVYFHINIFNYLKVSPGRLFSYVIEHEIEYTKIKPFLPILRFNTKYHKKLDNPDNISLINKIFDLIDNKSRNELDEYAYNLKIEKGLVRQEKVTPMISKEFDKLHKSIIKKAYNKETIQSMIVELQKLITN